MLHGDVLLYGRWFIGRQARSHVDGQEIEVHQFTQASVRTDVRTYRRTANVQKDIRKQDVQPDVWGMSQDVREVVKG